MKKGMKKAMALGLCAIMTTAMLAGCKSNGANSSKTSGDSSEPKQVTLKVVDWESDEMNAAIQDAFDNVFTKAHPNIKVEIVKGSYSDYGQQLAGMITAGEAPDVFQGGYDMAASFYQKKLLTDWTDKVAAEPDFVKSLYEGTMNGWQLDGKTYGFPSLVNVYGVFYNKDLLAAAGVSEPTADWTWDDLWAMAEKLKDPAKEKYGIYGLDTSGFGVANISTSYGGAPLMDKVMGTTKVTVDDKFIEQATKIQSLIADGTLPKRTYEVTNQNSMFEAGEMALMYYGQWEVDSLLKNCPDLKWGYAPTPQGPNGRTTTYDTVGWMSPKNLAHPEETWELIKFMSSDLYQTVLKVTPVAPCAHSASASVFYDVMNEKGHPEVAEAVKTMMETKTKNGVRYAADWSSDAGKLWDPVYNNILDGESKDPLTKLQDVANQINGIIAGN
ncbi:ABC transporter substrate-binding protein [Anaerocolumna chitinilytica]|uniref:Sugar ABC transporter substrate-binding protein n=1 Tax=Anaerocolumna chitinilytica TaxID=1727145 RepID=A0A7M3S9K3_9FIRM|nr:sugar ABC transporter substrate-binding protein [Anaerocolumna chitinilytica]BCK01271.1 hypothetical protein bsdcttw_43110 [Anaerocolumna chitinilytica]